MRAALFLAAAFLLLGLSQAQTVTQFTIIGAIQSLTVDNPSDILSGGLIKVNGVTVVVPSNLVIVFPAAYWTLSQAVKMGPAPGISGLALGDAVRSPGTYSAEIIGNIVKDTLVNSASPARYIAGEIKIAPEALQATDGYIRSINYTSGELCVGANSAPNVGPCTSPDARVRLIDPLGRYGMKQSKDDLRFAVDTDNPTVHAATGYPMCIPRVHPAVAVDPLCPIGNRPKDVFNKTMGTFVMSGPNYPALFLGGAGGGVTPFVLSCNNAPSVAANPSSATVCNPDQQAPLMPGDLITYSGVLTKDGAIGAYSVGASVGIYTQQGPGNTAYVTIEEMVIGTGPTSCRGGPNIECAVRGKVLGFSTDPSRVALSSNRLNFYYVDVDPATGVKTPRLAVQPQVLGTLGAPLGRVPAVLGRFLLDITFQTLNAQIPPTSGGPSGAGGLTRELLISIDDNGPLNPNAPVPNPADNPERVKANGIIAGQYWAPIPDFSFPEISTPGVQTPAANFNCLSHLVSGWNLDLYGNGTNVQIPPLTPWPGTLLAFAVGVNCDTIL